MGGTSEQPRLRLKAAWLVGAVVALAVMAVALVLVLRDPQTEEAIRPNPSNPAASSGDWDEVAPLDQLTAAEIAPIESLRASIAHVVPGSQSALSPDGSQLFVVRGDWLCVVELEVGAEDCIEEGFGAVQAAQWSADSRYLTWTNRADPDVISFDAETGELQKRTDDGQFGMSIDALRLTDEDTYATWSPGGERIAFFRRDTDGFAAAIWHADSQAVVAIPVPLVTRTGTSLSRQAIWPPQYPLFVGLDKVIAGGSGKVYEFDFGNQTVESILDYGGQYTLPFQGMEVPEGGNLAPVVALDEESWLLTDQAVMVAVQQGGPTTPGNGLYLADRRSGSIVPVFTSEPEIPAYIAPVNVAVSPSGLRLLVVWQDSQRVIETVNASAFVVSVMDVDQIGEEPVDLRSLPVLWDSLELDEAVFPALLTPHLEWSEEDTIALDLWDFGRVGGDGSTVVFKIGS